MPTRTIKNHHDVIEGMARVRVREQQPIRRIRATVTSIPACLIPFLNQ